MHIWQDNLVNIQNLVMVLAPRKPAPTLTLAKA